MPTKKIRIYTKGGDRGETSLFGGKRVGKESDRIEAVGSIDELNASLGLVKAKEKTQKIIRFIQNELFNIGALVADPDKLSQKTKKLSLFDTKKITKIEKLIDEIDQKLPQLNHFILPSGSKSGARLHFARTLARKAERRVVSLSKKEGVDENIIKFLNRLSDLLFVMARYENKLSGGNEIPWKKD